MSDSVAGRDGTLRIGDRLVSVNGDSFDGRTRWEAIDMIRTRGEDITLIVARRKQAPIRKRTVTVPKCIPKTRTGDDSSFGEHYAW